MWITNPSVSNSTNITNDQDTTKIVKHKELDRPSPASKKKVFLKSGLSLGKIELPKGWSYELCQTKGEKSNVALKFHSPEGLAYDGVQNAVAHLLQQNCCPTGNIKRRRRRSYSTSSCIKEDGPGRFGWFLRCTDKMHFQTRPYCPDQVGQLEVREYFLRWFETSWIVIFYMHSAYLIQGPMEHVLNSIGYKIFPCNQQLLIEFFERQF